MVVVDFFLDVIHFLIDKSFEPLFYSLVFQDFEEQFLKLTVRACSNLARDHGQVVSFVWALVAAHLRPSLIPEGCLAVVGRIIPCVSAIFLLVVKVVLDQFKLHFTPG